MRHPRLTGAADPAAAGSGLEDEPGAGLAVQDLGDGRRPCENERMRNMDGSILSIGSSGSILSIGSAGSILSIGSAGSILSIGSAGSIGSVLSVGSAASIGSVLSALSQWSVLAWRAKGAIPSSRRADA